MAETFFLTLTGQKQGQIKGDVMQKGRENQISVISIDHDIISPRDAASGLATGKRMHKPLILTKRVDKATPMLYSALVSNENIVSFTLNFFHSDSRLVEKNYYRVELVNASISEIHLRLNSLLLPSLVPVEEVSFTYQKIIWTYVDGGITSSDEWMANNV